MDFIALQWNTGW